MSENVDRWFAEARAGSSDALGQMLESCRDYLLLIAREEMDNGLQAKGGASDLVQDTFLEAYRDFAQFQGASEEELLRWLRRLLLNNLANFARRYRDTAKRQTACEVALEDGSSSTPSPHQVDAACATPSEQLMADEEAKAVERALDKLPPDYRQVILLRYRKELSFEEIGRLMDRSANAAEKLWGRAIHRLQQEVDTPP